MSLQLPNMPVPFIDPKTGLISIPWYKAMLGITQTVTGAVVTQVNISGNNGITVAGSPITTASVITLGIGNLTCASAQVAGTLTAINVVATAAVNAVNLIASNSMSSANIAATTTTSANIISTGTLTANNAVITGSLTFANPVTNSLAADVQLNNLGAFFDGPSVSVGPIGTWYVSGTVTVFDTTAGTSQYDAKIWDGTTVIASAAGRAYAAGGPVPIALSGFIQSPAGNLRISVKDLSAISGAILANNSGSAKDSTITALRIA